MPYSITFYTVRKGGLLSPDDFLQKDSLVKRAARGVFFFADTGQVIPSTAPGFDDGAHNFQQARQFLQGFALLVFSQFFVQFGFQSLNNGIVGQRLVCAMVLYENSSGNTIKKG